MEGNVERADRRGQDTAAAALLREFVSDEERALIRREQGHFYPDHHHLIKPLLKRATTLLTADERIALYFHLLRLNEWPSMKTEDELALLRSAHVRVLPLLSQRYPACSLGRASSLWLLGADDDGPLPDERAPSVETYGERLTFWRYANSFWHIPGLLEKHERFARLALDEGLVLRAHRVVQRVDLDRDLLLSTCLWFWAFVYLILHHDAFAAAAAHRVVHGARNTERAQTMRSILDRALVAAGREGSTSLIDRHQT